MTPEQHQRLKAMAALQGKSIKEFVLASTLGEQPHDPELAELEALLDRRVEKARAQGADTRSVKDIFKQARGEAART